MSTSSGMTDISALPEGATVPDDFPRDPFPAALSGAQPKFSARLIDDKYVVGLTDDERSERYLVCLDLVEQMTAYVNRKRTQSPEKTAVDVLDNLDTRIRHQGWELGEPEFAWVMQQLRARF